MFGGSFNSGNGFNQQQPPQPQQQPQGGPGTPFGSFGGSTPANNQPVSSGFGMSSTLAPTPSTPVNPSGMSMSTNSNHGSVQMNTNNDHNNNQSGFGFGVSSTTVVGSGFASSSPFARPSGPTDHASPFGGGGMGTGSGFGMSDSVALGGNAIPSNVSAGAPSPFGTSSTLASGNGITPSAPTSASVFGVSSNTVGSSTFPGSNANADMSADSNVHTATGFAMPSNTTNAGFGNSGFDQQSTNVFASPFGNSSSTAPTPAPTGFGANAADTSNAMVSPFGQNNSIAGVGTGMDVNNMNESNDNFEWVNPNSKKKQTGGGGVTEAAEKAQELAKLKARLEEKKKKIMAMKLKAQAQSQTQTLSQSKPLSQPIAQMEPRQQQLQSRSLSSSRYEAPRESSQQKQQIESLNKGLSMTPPPPKDRDHKKKDKRKGLKKDKSSSSFTNSSSSSSRDNNKQSITGDKATLAAKNEKRFAQNTVNSNTFAMLPKDLHQQARDYHPSNQDGDVTGDNGDSGPEGNLIGTCVHMCPDEELIRRESENGVQTLELVCKGIHPPNWTLRDTAVKRFRRSAADFKLDIPELVRPPHVLERVCGYLEEWVMERDRQGLDVRFGNDTGNNFGLGNSNANKNVQIGTVPPLDVYQFIWDRTRMVRKDFILQNFIGTGGRCNATVVRCHERIARWHAMCEHQLSHIPDFVIMQSQQNIQELGATMKSLNMFYDDAEGRSTIDDHGDFGNPPDTADVHGCQSPTVMGKDPVDYNGESLANTDETMSVSNRIIGNDKGGSGTAESEMRGLYILLTINNDGGMEVLKYAARLSRDRPGVFNSQPVQLALQVYKAKREYNYAKFFSLLRSPSTPYLYSCIMFKYVETMRKAAFRIMSRTFGAKKKDTGEGFYDQYPLADLVHLLAFEDLEEARNACNHYNITVETMRKAAFRIMSRTFGAKKKDTGEGFYDQYPLADLVHLLAFEDLEEARNACNHYNITVEKIPLTDGSKKDIDIVFWRGGKGFREPRDPEKGTTLSLKPRKMIRTIESKLNGATRLAICRGEVSGDGATLNANNANNLKISQERAKKREENRLKRKQAIEQAKRFEAEQKQALQKKKEAILQKQAIEQARRKEAQQKEDKLKRQIEGEKMRLRQEAEEKLRKIKEAETERKRLESIERQRQEEILRQQQKQEEEIERRRLEEMERKHRKQLEEQKRQEEAERERERLKRVEKERQEKLERQRLEAKAEAERLRLERIERKRQEQLEKKRREEEAEMRRIELEWLSKIECARKFVTMKIWSSRLIATRGKRDKTKSSIESFDPLSTRKNDYVQDIVEARDKRKELLQLQSLQELESEREMGGQIENEIIEVDWEKEPPCTRTSIESFNPFPTPMLSPLRKEMALEEMAAQQPSDEIEIKSSVYLHIDDQEDENLKELVESESYGLEQSTADQFGSVEFDSASVDGSSKMQISSNKRQIGLFDNDPAGRKRSKLLTSSQRLISEDLQKSKNFTENLRAIENMAGIGQVLNDPILAKLFESDENLKRLRDNVIS